MKEVEESNLIIKLCKYGVEHNAFKIEEFYSVVKDINNQDKRYIEKILLDWGGAPDPNHLITFVTSANNATKAEPQRQEYLSKYNVRLLPSAHFSYIDHLEVVEARKAAKEAKKLSWIAIFISIGIGLVQIIIEVLKK
jgi:hypothetical protein